MRLVTALLWALAALGMVYWGLRLSGWGAPRQLPSAVAQAPAVDPGARQAALARLLGAQPAAAGGPAPGAADRFVLWGVIATSAAGQGVVLVSIDGQPPRPLTVGAEIAPGLLLQEVSRREAIVRDGAQARIVLKLPTESAAQAAALSAGPGAPRTPIPVPSAAIAVPAKPPARPTQSPAATRAPVTAPPAPVPASAVTALPAAPGVAPNAASPVMRGDPALAPSETLPPAGRSPP